MHIGIWSSTCAIYAPHFKCQNFFCGLVCNLKDTSNKPGPSPEMQPLPLCYSTLPFTVQYILAPSIVSLFNSHTSHTFSLWQNTLPPTSGHLQTTGTSSGCDRLVLGRSKGLRVWSFSGHINKKKQDKHHWTDRKPQSNKIPCSVLQYLIVWWRFLDSRHFLQTFFTTKNKQK